jgi:hypothetical protein
MKAPRRLIDDPSAPAELRAGLTGVADSAATYNVAVGLAALQRALATPVAQPGPEVTATRADQAMTASSPELTSANGSDAAAGSSQEAAAVSSQAAASPHRASAASGQPGATSGVAPGASGSWLNALPIFVKLALLAAAGGMTVLAVIRFAPRERSQQTAPAATSAPIPVAAHALRRTPEQETAQQPARMDDPPPSASAAVSDTRTREATTAAPVPTPSRREIALMLRIKTLLDREPRAAHRLIRAARREFPHGVFAEERAGLNAIALFAFAPHSRARAEAERFIAQHPQSTLRPRLERLLAAEREESPGQPERP